MEEIILEEKPPQDRSSIERLKERYTPTQTRFLPEDSPFTTLIADITHRCNMACKNCYIPVRDLPDLPADWLYEFVARLPRRTRIRLVGAEPTVREDLPEIISTIRKLGHIPVILSNGLKLGRKSYLQKLKDAGLGTIYLSLNGGLEDHLYQAIDGMPVAARKLRALHNLLNAHVHVTTGTILVPDVNIEHMRIFIPYLIDQGVKDMHFRSVGEFGDYMQGKSLNLDELEAIVRGALPADGGELRLTREFSSSRDFRYGGTLVQITEWPELESMERGRISPDGFVEPMFESILANENQY